jgi:hypothetical protein
MRADCPSGVNRLRGRSGESWTLAILLLSATVLPASAGAATQRPHTKEYAITIDATALNPPTWWYVPGVTPIIWSMEPDNTEALRTTTPHELKLKPGSYRFGTFTFDFPFTVTLEGKLDYASSLDQCVGGRGSNALTIRCSRTQPYGGQADYWNHRDAK